MRNPIDMETDVGLEEGVWTVSVQSKGENPLDVWSKHYADRESAQNDALALGLIDAIGDWYHRAGEVIISPDELERHGFTPRAVLFNFRVAEGGANWDGTLLTQNRVSLPKLGDVISHSETGCVKDYKVKRVSRHILDGKVVYTIELG